MANDHYDKLDYLIILAEEKNLTHAASRLYISQPALTAYINRIEKELGVKLFERSRNPIELTRAGSIYLDEMQQLRDRALHLRDSIRTLDQHPTDTLSIGIGRNRGACYLHTILSALYKKFPDAQIRIEEARDVNMTESLTRNLLDVAITESAEENMMLEHTLIGNEKMYLITGADNPMFKEFNRENNSPYHPMDIPPATLDNMAFISPSSTYNLTRYSRQLFSLYSIHPKEMRYFSNAVTCYRLAMQNLGFTLLTSDYMHMIQTKNKPLFMMPGRKPMLRPIYVVTNKNAEMTPLKKAFLEITMHILDHTQDIQGISMSAD